ncbi:distal tail protein Dit [Halalkalibacterium halodurans]|uniref:distal tail protein Dit n=1 Tax=Halalkalibacterium halodurans TaxID=86665 RepID=UPI002AA9D0F8|nr:distal tail protein Dit [Halalkalibacterium halodurans]MDY7224665.1 phage tail family protein [Halalkalibacterium halodurans]MDY7243228.1 phage tail family protein [Halalkalibacterium halodurans]
MMHMTFNGVRKTNIYLLEGRQKGPFAPLNREITSIGRSHRLRRTDKGLLEIQQPIGYKAITRDDALRIKDEIAAWLVTDSWAPLQFDDELGRTYWSVVDGTLEDLARDSRSVLWRGTVKFLSAYTTGQEHEINVPTTYQSFTIRGQDQTPWTTYTRFTAPRSQYTLETNKGLYVLLNYNFIEGDILRIDYSKREVTLNNKDLAVSVSLSTNWAMLQPGTVQVRASEPTTVTYTERYY